MCYVEAHELLRATAAVSATSHMHVKYGAVCIRVHVIIWGFEYEHVSARRASSYVDRR